MQESIAINVYNSLRDQKLLQPIFAIVDPKKADQLLKQYRASLFPEERWSDLRLMKKNQGIFKKLKKRNHEG